MRVKRVIGLLILLGGFQVIPTYGQVVATWAGSSGAWSNSTNWSTLTAPNNGGGTTYTVVINGTGADTVTFDAGGTVINSLTLGTGETFQDNSSSPTLIVGGLTNNGTINWGNAANLLVLGTATNSGTVNVNGSTTTISGSFTNNGIVNVTGSGGLVIGGGGPSGRMVIDHSTLTVNGDFGCRLPDFSERQPRYDNRRAGSYQCVCTSR